MPSPFPGMDPYLESPLHFPDLHDRLITFISELLQGRLPEPYYATIAERVWIEVGTRRIEPDLNVVRAAAEAEREGGVAVLAEAAVWLADTATEPVVVSSPHEDHTDKFVEIMTRVGDDERIVTTVEILSAANKKRGGEGRRQYLRKQDEVLASESNLVEIDLLRWGTHTTAVPEDWITEHRGEFQYHACTTRPYRPNRWEVYPIRLREKLPTISVPLSPGERDVALDLQAAFDRAYDSGPYRRRVRYRESLPMPRVSLEDAAWVAERIAAAGK